MGRARLLLPLFVPVAAFAPIACGIGVTGAYDAQPLEAGVAEEAGPRDGGYESDARLDAAFDADAEPTAFASCKDAKMAGVSTDGEVLLFLPNAPSQRFSAYCADMTASDPKTYLTLVETNTSSYDATVVGVTTVVTTWKRVWFDPATLVVDTADYRFASSVGQVYHPEDADNGNYVTHVPYGVARDCAGLSSALGQATIDLRGLPFAVDRTLSTWALGGYMPAGTVTSADPAVIAITGGGRCGWNAIGTSRFGGKMLHLVYRP